MCLQSAVSKDSACSFPLVSVCWGGAGALNSQCSCLSPKRWAPRHTATPTSAQHPGLLLSCVREGVRRVRTCRHRQGGHSREARQCHQPAPRSRFQDKEWIRANERGSFPTEFLNFREVPVEAVDASGCTINYQGMSNLRE